MKTSKSKTFTKDDTQLHEVIDWLVEQVETVEWQPSGTNWGGGEPGPMDPRCDLKHKYIIQVIKIVEP